MKRVSPMFEIVLLTFVAAITALAFVIVSIQIIASIGEARNEPAKPAPWTILCDGDGSFTYTDSTGDSVEETYSTRSSAEREMERLKRIHADVVAGKYRAERAAREAAKNERDKRFKPCEPEVAP